MSVSHAAWYGTSIHDFLSASDTQVLDALAATSAFDVDLNQRDAWREEIHILRTTLRDVASSGGDGWIYLEFDVPRLGTRIDAVVIAGAAVIPIEFKVGEARYRRTDIDQTWDYGLDLKNFHEASHDASVFPLLVATAAAEGDSRWTMPHPDGVRPPCCANVESLGLAVRRALTEAKGKLIDGKAWGCASYRPTPTIIQAARALYKHHTADTHTVFC